MTPFEYRMSGHDRPESDLMGLSIDAYGQRAPERRLAALDNKPAELPRAGNTALICAAIFAASVLACAVVLKGWPWI